MEQYKEEFIHFMVEADVLMILMYCSDQLTRVFRLVL